MPIAIFSFRSYNSNLFVRSVSKLFLESYCCRCSELHYIRTVASRVFLEKTRRLFIILRTRNTEETVFASAKIENPNWKIGNVRDRKCGKGMHFHIDPSRMLLLISPDQRVRHFVEPRIQIESQVFRSDARKGVVRERHIHACGMITRLSNSTVSFGRETQRKLVPVMTINSRQLRQVSHWNIYARIYWGLIASYR